jgi:hypothetical protein
MLSTLSAMVFAPTACASRWIASTTAWSTLSAPLPRTNEPSILR